MEAEAAYLPSLLSPKGWVRLKGSALHSFVWEKHDQKPIRCSSIMLALALVRSMYTGEVSEDVFFSSKAQ